MTRSTYKSTTGARKPAKSSKRTSGSANTPWTDEELRHSVGVYMLLLRIQLQGIEDKSEPVAQALLSGPLALRNDVAIRYRMRNISAVAKELGGPTLNDFSPAESVGVNVRPRIRAMLLEHFDFNRALPTGPVQPGQARRDAFTALAVLREQIESLERELFWLGHNNPPDPVGEWTVERIEFRSAVADIESIQAELEKHSPNVAIIESGKSRLIRFGTMLMKWVGGRVTKFADAALVAAAPIAVVKLSGLMPALINAIESVTRAVGH